MACKGADWPRGSCHRGKESSLTGARSGHVRGLRINLTLWYCGVMAAALVLFSGLSTLAHSSFSSSIKDDTARHAMRT